MVSGIQLILDYVSVVKPLSAKWFVQLSDYFKANPEIIKNGFKGAGITAEYLAS